MRCNSGEESTAQKQIDDVVRSLTRHRINANPRNLLPDVSLTVGDNEMLSTILIVLLILLFNGALPAWPYSAEGDYATGGVLGMILVVVPALVVVLVLALLGGI